MSLSICVIGGGMVGASAAIALAKQGHHIKLIETKPIDAENILQNDTIDMRVSAINRCSETLLTNLGAWSHIEAARKAQYNQLSVQDHQAKPLVFSNSEIDQSHLGHIIENSIIQASLWREFEQYPIEVISDLGRINKIDNNEKVTLHFEQHSLQFDLVVVADGAGSVTRDLVGIGTTGWQYQQACMGILIKLAAPQQTITWQEFQATGPVAFLPMQAPYASLVWYHQGARLEALTKSSNEQLKNEILTHFPKLPGDFDIVNRCVFPISRLHANNYHTNNVVLIGDAAHAINPMAGQGVNLGFKDVLQLTKSMEQKTVLSEALKDYERKRRTPNLAMMSMMDACYLTFSNNHSPLKALRRGVISGLSKLPLLKREILKYAVGNYL
jgi:2-octaprenyl-3-methyl-6-methoxy-1,4-benzoquinol hydroxylase